MCHFDISPFSNHSIYNKKFYNLQETGKDYNYRILNRSTMDSHKLYQGIVITIKNVRHLHNKSSAKEKYGAMKILACIDLRTIRSLVSYIASTLPPQTGFVSNNFLTVNLYHLYCIDSSYRVI